MRDAPVKQPHTVCVTGSVQKEEAADVDLSHAQKLTWFLRLVKQKTIQSYHQHKSLVSFHLFATKRAFGVNYCR